MRLKSYIEDLKRLEKKIGNVELIYATDDEGNCFNIVNYSPGIKYVSQDDLDNGYIDGMDVYDDATNVNNSNKSAVAVVCIN